MTRLDDFPATRLASHPDQMKERIINSRMNPRYQFRPVSAVAALATLNIATTCNGLSAADENEWIELFNGKDLNDRRFPEFETAHRGMILCNRASWRLNSI